MKCTDCYFFYNAPAFGRDPKSCSELGEQANSEACSAFRPRGSVPPTLAPTEVQLDPDKPIDFEYSEAFRRIYGEQLQIERDLFETTQKIETEFFQDQAAAQMDSTFTRYTQKLADLRLLHVLCGLFECDVYRDVIMAAEIEKLFGVKPSAETIASIQKSMRDTANAGILRVSDSERGTSVGGSAKPRSGK